jgi:hypothetical protein
MLDEGRRTDLHAQLVEGFAGQGHEHDVTSGDVESDGGESRRVLNPRRVFKHDKQSRGQFQGCRVSDRTGRKLSCIRTQMRVHVALKHLADGAYVQRAS